jgi:two-component system capsular synthesis response regulator RcsB
MHDNAGVLGSIARMEVSGLVSKADASGELINAIQTVMEGRSYLSRTIRQTVGCEAMSRLPTKTRLSPREAEVLRLFSSGLTGNEIAATLHRSKKTISRQKVSAFHKLGVSSNVEFFVYLREMRGQAEWLSSPDRQAAESALAPFSAETLDARGLPEDMGTSHAPDDHRTLEEAVPPGPVIGPRESSTSLPVWGNARSVLR